ncbi:MAG: hypothetical protein HC800_02080 [Phormidesmis sp. RL_2_1]|nr:hypothetical protein [Phormidesmis sp. RL_2_1]
MTVMQKVASFFHMTDSVWARHANPWSVWTRYVALPVLVMAIWSRVWLGWGAVVPSAIALIWIWLNPRIFPRPQTTHHWASKAVLGERVWLNRQQRPIPQHHNPVIAFTNMVNVVGFSICLTGLITLSPCLTVFGLSWIILGKTWFLDRMVWVYEDMKTHPQYSKWLY